MVNTPQNLQKALAGLPTLCLDSPEIKKAAAGSARFPLADQEGLVGPIFQWVPGTFGGRRRY
jgi:hypothetical protein